MRKRERIRHERLQAKEADFESILLVCLKKCAAGRWGLFGQNSLADPADRYWTWPEAKHLRTLAAEIVSERALIGEKHAICEKFIRLCEDKGSNALGEPKLAAMFLEELGVASGS